MTCVPEDNETTNINMFARKKKISLLYDISEFTE